MELPEQDRQALIEAARRRGQGGAAFGVYPSSGKRPERLNVSRDVNMPAQLARGWVAGTLGLPGDIEGLGRMLINMAPAGQEHERVTGRSFVSETPVLPTSDFYKEWLPGGDERPAAKFASGLGALAGGAGSTKVAGAAVKGAKATGKALGPKAAEMAEGYLKKSGLAPELIAYQGSPHKFAPEPDAPFGKFKAEKIGTGEGAQAYGHGHYTAEARNVAQSYADVLASPRNRVGEGRGVYIEPSPMGGGKYMLAVRSEIGQPRGMAADATQFIYPEKEFSSIAAAVKFAKRKGLLSKDERPKLTAVNEDRKYVPVTKAADVAEPEYTQFIASDPGYLYTVDIPDEKVAMMLDLDRPLAEQSPEVQKALSNVSGAEYAAEYFAKNRKEAPTGADLQEFLRLSGMNPPEISAKMLEAGIPGVKYLDEGSRGPSGSGRWNIKFPDGTEQIFNFKPSDDVLKQMNATAEPVGTRNFVIFPGEEESVKIIDRKAEGGLVEDTDAIAAKLTGMDKDKALTHALRMANAKQEAHMGAGGFLTLAKGAKAAKAAEEAAAAAKAAKVAKPVEKAAPVLPVAPRAQALEKARKNAIKAGQSPKEAERMLQQGYEPDWYHGTTGDIKALERERLGQATGAESAKKAFFFVRDPSTPPPEMLEKTRDPKSIDMMKKLGFSDEELAKLNEVSMKGHGAETASGYSQIGGSREYNEAMRKANAAERAGKWSEYEKWMQVAEDSEIGRMESAQDLVAKYGEARDVMLDRINNAVLNKPLPQQEAEALDAQMKQLMPYGWYNSYSIPQLKALKGEIVKLAGPDAAVPALQSIDDFISVKANRMLEDTYQEGSNVMPVALRYKNPMYYDFGGSTYRDQSYSDLIDQARAGGHDALIIKNTFDPGAGPAKLVDIGAVFKPEQVRSRFAAFDPARVNENDLLGAADPALLAGTAVASGIGLGALGQMSKPKPKQEEKKKAAGGLAKRM